MVPQSGALPRFHPATKIRDLGDGQFFTLADASCGVAAFGATGSSKTSATSRFLSLGYMAAGMGGIVLCAKPSEKDQVIAWAKEAGREQDVIVFDASGSERFNFLNWEAGQDGEGGGLTINVVALLEEIISAIEPMRGQGGGESQFFEDALHQLLIAVVQLVQLAGYELSLSTMQKIVRSAPNSREEARSQEWRNEQECPCWFFLEEARKACESADDATQADYEECRAYFMEDFCKLSEKTRSVIVLMFTKLAQPFAMSPLRELFATETTGTPEATFDGKIIIVALDTQSYRQVGVIAAVVWKYCWQIAVMRRRPAPPGEYLRPAFCLADEAAENFLSKSDSAFQAVARASAGCVVYLAQNISQYRKRLGNDDAFEALMANFQTKIFHQNTGPTNAWASQLLGQEWRQITSISTNQNGKGSLRSFSTPASSGVSVSEQLRYLVESSTFTTLKRGGDAYGFEVTAIWYKGGFLFDTGQPFKLLQFRQR